jgi:fermentation-respiration switch protein FrsA (DUF1100 family)
MKRAWRWALVAAGAGALMLALWSGMENQFLYFPTRVLAATPASYGLDAEELALTAEDGVRLHGWWIRGRGERAVLFFHGNAGNVADRLDRAKILHRRFGLDLFLVDYRGYGKSEGSPSEEGLYRDSRAVHAAALAKGFPSENVLLFGESLGSAVAVNLALERRCGGVVLETPFLSLRAMAREHYPFVPFLLVRSRFDNEAKISAVAAPKLFLVAERDEIAPPEQGRRLFELAAEPKTLFVIPGAGHNDTYVTGGEAYWSAWERFLERLST